MDVSIENKNNSHTFLITFSWTQSSPAGGRKDSVLKKILKVFNNDLELEEYINKFLQDDDGGYRTNIALNDVRRI